MTGACVVVLCCVFVWVVSQCVGFNIYVQSDSSRCWCTLYVLFTSYLLRRSFICPVILPSFTLHHMPSSVVLTLVPPSFCLLPQIHKPVIFSTSPHAKYTHWKQTVFYLTEPLTVCPSEIIEGEIYCAPNTKNVRDLDIEIKYAMNGQHTTVDCKQQYRLR